MMYKNYLLQLTRKCITWKPKQSNPKKTCYIDISMGYATKHSWAWKPTSQSANLGPRYLSECHQVKKARNCPGRHPKQFQGFTWEISLKNRRNPTPRDNLATCQSFRGPDFCHVTRFLWWTPNFSSQQDLQQGCSLKIMLAKGKGSERLPFLGL